MPPDRGGPTNSFASDQLDNSRDWAVWTHQRYDPASPRFCLTVSADFGQSHPWCRNRVAIVCPSAGPRTAGTCGWPNSVHRTSVPCAPGVVESVAQIFGSVLVRLAHGGRNPGQTRWFARPNRLRRPGPPAGASAGPSRSPSEQSTGLRSSSSEVAIGTTRITGRAPRGRIICRVRKVLTTTSTCALEVVKRAHPAAHSPTIRGSLQDRHGERVRVTPPD